MYYFYRFNVSAKFVNFGRGEKIHQCHGKFSERCCTQTNRDAGLGFKGGWHACANHYGWKQSKLVQEWKRISDSGLTYVLYCSFDLL